jgi:hypothetical protein
MNTVMTYALLEDLATQRQSELAARAARAQWTVTTTPASPTATTRRTPVGRRRGVTARRTGRVSRA